MPGEWTALTLDKVISCICGSRVNSSALENDQLPQIWNRLLVVVLGSHPHHMSACISVHVECSGFRELKILCSYFWSIGTKAILVGTLVREDVHHHPLVLGPSVGYAHGMVSMSVHHLQLTFFELNPEQMTCLRKVLKIITRLVLQKRWRRE